MKKMFVLGVLTFFILIEIYHNLFFFRSFIIGDFPYFFPSMLKDITVFPYVWEVAGIGSFSAPLLWVKTTFAFPVTILGSILYLPWAVATGIGFFLPFFIFGFFLPLFLFKKVFSSNSFSFLASLIFLANSYVLLLISGGQVMIALAYAIIPLILLLVFQNKRISSIWIGLVFAFQLFFDLRIFYVSLVALGLFTVVILGMQYFRSVKEFLVFILRIFIIPGIIVIGVHAFWILPTLLNRQNPVTQLGSAYDTTGAVKFFSFAKFENSLGLLHPNWPENIFGLVHFMQPEFILLPILAFGSLLFIGKQKRRENIYVLYFALLALVGIFLAKGANDPFGGVYLWLFNHVPGFVMFRDPTKWYTFVAVSYSVLIPYTLWRLYEWLTEKFSAKFQLFNIQNGLVVLFVLFWLFTIRQAVMGQLTGTFKPHTIPLEYITLETFLNSQNAFSRTFWVPSTRRFGYYSSVHPAVNAEIFYNVSSVSGVIDNLQNESTEKIMQDAGVKYIIVPYDSEGELFVTDRKYDNKMYLDTIASVSAIPWLTKINGFGRIAVFQVPDQKDHFWLLTKDGKEETVSYSFVNPTKYGVRLQNIQSGDRLVFSESYDKNWEITKPKITSQKYEDLFNSFVLQNSGSYTLTVDYGLQKWVVVGLWISIASAIIAVGLLISLQLFFRKLPS